MHALPTCSTCDDVTRVGCNIVVKAEQLNPGGSVKDRAAKFLIEDAEKKGLCDAMLM